MKSEGSCRSTKFFFAAAVVFHKDESFPRQNVVARLPSGSLGAGEPELNISAADVAQEEKMRING